MASTAVKSKTAAKSSGTEEKGTAKAADLVFEDDDFEEFPGEWEHSYHGLQSLLHSLWDFEEVSKDVENINEPRKELPI